MSPPLKHPGEPWLTPFDSKVLGGLRGKINQHADGTVTILTPKRPPTQAVNPSDAITIVPPPPVCEGVAVDGVIFDPVKNPYALGDVITCTPFDLSGTAPIFYAWYLNSVFVTNAATFVHTLVDADVLNKDDTGLGQTFIFLAVGNCGGVALTPILAPINVQGTPPP